MTVSATPYKESYTGNGVTTAFPVPFYFLVDTDLAVSDVDNTVTPAVITPLAINIGYTVAGAGTPTGGVVNTTVPVAVGHGLTVERSLAEDQPTHFVDGDPLPASGLEQALDRIVMLYQQAKAALDRSAKFVVGSTSATDLPEPAEGYVLGWVSGKLRNLAAASAQLAADLLSTAIGKGASLIGYLAPYTGAVAVTQASQNANTLNVKNFGVVGDGTTDDSAALNAFFTNMVSGVLGTCKRVIFPNGRYKIGSTVTIPPFSGASMNLDQRSSDGMDWEIDFCRSSIICACDQPFALTAGTYPASRNQLYIHDGIFVPSGAQAVTAAFYMTGSRYWQIQFERISANKWNGTFGTIVSYYNDSASFQGGMISLKHIEGINTANIITFGANAGSIAAGTNVVDNFQMEDIYHQCADASSSTIKLTSFNLYASNLQKIITAGLGKIVDGNGNYITSATMTGFYWEPSGVAAVNALECQIAYSTISNFKAIANSSTQTVRWLVGDIRFSRISNVHVDASNLSGAHPYSNGSYIIMYLTDGRGNIYDGYTPSEWNNCRDIAATNRLGTVLGVSDDMCLLDSIDANPTGITTSTTTILATSPYNLLSILEGGTSVVLDVQFHGYGSDATSKMVQNNLVIGTTTVNIGGAITLGSGAYLSRAKVILAPASGSTWDLFVLNSESINQAGTITYSSIGMIQVASSVVVNSTDSVALNVVTTGMSAGAVWPISATLSRIGRGMANMVNP